jgi:hypothetical protein
LGVHCCWRRQQEEQRQNPREENLPLREWVEELCSHERQGVKTLRAFYRFARHAVKRKDITKRGRAAAGKAEILGLTGIERRA